MTALADRAAASAIMEEPVTVEVHPTFTPARDIPLGMRVDVQAVLAAHGLEPDGVEVLLALMELVNRTPVGRGGRLLPDGTVDSS